MEHLPKVLPGILCSLEKEDNCFAQQNGGQVNVLYVYKAQQNKWKYHWFVSY